MKRMIYLMNVDWNWIKQRPHFIAEELRNKVDITIVNQQRYSRKNLQKRDLSNDVYNMRVIPRIDRYAKLRWINVYIKKNILRKLIKEKSPEYIYVTEPNQIEWIPNSFEGRIIYDCMDDHIGLARNNNLKARMLKNEKKIAQKADYIIYSSDFLKKLFHKRYGTNLSLEEAVVRNGFNGQICPFSECSNNPIFSICYFGTISDWFDFEIIIDSLEKHKELEYVLIGPLHRNTTIPNHDRIRYLGIVEHDQLYEETKNVDCFVMPFKLDESIKAVDPVKLYEYINFGKNIICIGYEEVQRFSEFAYFYNTREEYNELVGKLIEDNSLKYNDIMRKQFLMDSSWMCRGNQVLELLGVNIRSSDD